MPLVLETTIALPDVGGRIDHLAVDLARKRLFVAEVGNNTLDAIDMVTQKPVHRIAGLDEPQGVAYLPTPDLIVVGNGGDGAVRFFSGADFSSGFHTFGVDWQPDRITWYVDGVARATCTNRSLICDEASYPILNLGVGGNWPGNPDASTPFPATMDVDYVRVYQKS